MKILFYLFIKPLSRLPLYVLYRLSDVLYPIIYYLIRYRRKVVEDNLRHSFPEKTEHELKNIAKKFYRYFCDIIIESFRLISMPKAEFIRRVKVLNPELINHYYQQGRNVAIICGHYGNWEWFATSMGLPFQHAAVAIYKPLSNPFFEKIATDYRSRFGLELIKKGDFKTKIKDYKNKKIALLFIGDQCPSPNQKVYWMNFLNQETAVMVGAEVYSKRYDYVVMMMNTTKVKRGYYELSFEMVEDQPEQSDFGVITAQSTRILERQIQAKPAYWLWTHRRWKRKRTNTT